LHEHRTNRREEGEQGVIPSEHRPERCSRGIGGTSGDSEILADAEKLFGDGGDDNAGIVVGRNSVPKSRNDRRAKDVADAANDGLGRREQQPQSVEGSRHVADTDVSQREGVRCANRSDLEHSDPHASSAWWRCDPAEASESGVGRMANGVAARVDRLKAIGNGQVPSVAALAWRLLN
jgi:hypothetical protein